MSGTGACAESGQFGGGGETGETGGQVASASAKKVKPKVDEDMWMHTPLAGTVRTFELTAKVKGRKAATSGHLVLAGSLMARKDGSAVPHNQILVVTSTLVGFMVDLGCTVCSTGSTPCCHIELMLSQFTAACWLVTGKL